MLQSTSISNEGAIYICVSPFGEVHIVYCGYITVVEPYQLLCYGSNFSKLHLAGWFEVPPRSYDFHSAKQPMI